MQNQQQLPQEIGEQLAELLERFYNTRPGGHVVHVLPDMVVVVFHEVFTGAERHLIEREQAQGIVEIRRRFERSAERHFRAVVEKATQREVEAFISDVHLETNVAVQLFLTQKGLRENMAAFEDEMERPESEQACRERHEREEG